ncbi:MAG: NACHT domain-containing protein, partial [Bacteroidota bacterium]
MVGAGEVLQTMNMHYGGTREEVQRQAAGLSEGQELLGSQIDQVDAKIDGLSQQFSAILQAPHRPPDTKVDRKFHQEAQQTLRKNYQSHYSHIETFDGRYWPTENLYTRLVIVKRSAVRRIEDDKMRKVRAAPQVQPGDEKLSYDGKHAAEARARRMRQPYLEAYENMQRLESAIELEELFDDRDGKTMRTVLLLGRAGIGKTTLCHRLAYLWANNKWYPGKFEAVYVLPVRNLKKEKYNGTDLRSQRNLETAIAQECYSASSLDDDAYKQLTAYITRQLRDRSEKVLIVLDGLDERSGVSDEIIGQAKSRGKHAYRLWLSRPYGVNEEYHILAADPHALIVDNMGFNQQHIQKYVVRYFSKDRRAEEKHQAKAERKAMPSAVYRREKKEGKYHGTEHSIVIDGDPQEDAKCIDTKHGAHADRRSIELTTFSTAPANPTTMPPAAKALLTFLEDHSEVHGLAYIPINLEIFCALWMNEQQREGFREAATGSYVQLYDLMCAYIWKRYQAKLCLEQLGKSINQLHEEKEIEQYSVLISQKERLQEPLYTILGRIALKGLEEGQLLIGAHTVEGCLEKVPPQARVQLRSMLKKSGFLRKTERGDCYFPHLTLQEYFAGQELARLCQQESDHAAAAVLLNKYKYRPQYQVMLRFMAGAIVHQAQSKAQEQRPTTRDSSATSAVLKRFFLGSSRRGGYSRISSADLEESSLGNARSEAGVEQLMRMLDHNTSARSWTGLQDVLCKLRLLNECVALDAITPQAVEERYGLISQYCAWARRGMHGDPQVQHALQAALGTLKHVLNHRKVNGLYTRRYTDVAGAFAIAVAGAFTGAFAFTVAFAGVFARAG